MDNDKDPTFDDWIYWASITGILVVLWFLTQVPTGCTVIG